MFLSTQEVNALTKATDFWGGAPNIVHVVVWSYLFLKHFAVGVNDVGPDIFSLEMDQSTCTSSVG